MKRYRVCWTDADGHSQEERFWFKQDALRRAERKAFFCGRATVSDIWTGEIVAELECDFDQTPPL